MKKDKNPLKEKITCPLCGSQFIPESFHLEKPSLEPKWYKSERMDFGRGSYQLNIRPFTLIRRFWVTHCTECGYILKFAAEIGKKELVDDPTGKGGSGEFGEFGKTFTHNFYSIENPYMDYLDYFVEKLNIIQEDIKKVLDEIKMAEWGSIYKDWKENKTIDSFKFLVRFISSLDDYYKSQLGNDVKKEMPDKIKELNFSEALSESLIKINNIRNKAVHKGYELDDQDDNTIDETFFQFMFNLVLKQLKKLNLNEIQIEKEYNFIDVNKIKLEIRGFLGRYLGGNLRLKDLYKNFLIPLLEKLEISTE